MSTYEIQEVTQDDEHLQALTAYIMNDSPQIKAEVRQDILP